MKVIAGLLKRQWLDYLCLIVVVLANPLLYLFNGSPYYFPPDTLKYVTFGRVFFADWLLYLPSWEHVDSGAVLPPLYPWLIALGASFSESLVGFAEQISTVSLLLAGPTLYVLLRQRSDNLVALCAVMVLQFNYTYCYIGLVPLTEALFILVSGCTLLAFACSLKQNCRWLHVGVGVLCALVFLSRQVGIVVLGFCLLWGLVAELEGRKIRHIGVAKRPLLILVGFLFLVGPYASVLYVQAGVHPFQQKFRLGAYTVSTNDPAVLAEIERIETPEPKSYFEIYAKRRQMRRLLPDGSEMYYALAGIDQARDGALLNRIIRTLGQPEVFARNVIENFTTLKKSLGVLTSLLLLATVLSSAFLRDPNRPFAQRHLLFAFVCAYLLGISVISSPVARYIEVMIPFAVLLVTAELSLVCRRAISSRWQGYLPLGATLAILGLAGILMPRHFDSLDLGEKFATDHYVVESLQDREPLFGLAPWEAHMIRAWHRILPNDRLDKVAAYGRRTGVSWILVSKHAGNRGEIRLYSHAGWYHQPDLHLRYPDLVEFCCTVADGQGTLYRIKPAAD